MLATFVVSSAADVVDSGDGVTTLREAIESANLSPGADLVTFDETVFSRPTTVDLTLGSLSIDDSIQITGPDLPLTLRASGNHRVIDASINASTLILSDLRITGGNTSADDEGGGAIRFQSGGTLQLESVALFDNQTVGDRSAGGAVWASGTVNLVDSVITANQTAGANANGGGLYIQDGGLSSLRSEFSGNQTIGLNSHGGGFFAASTASLSQTVVQGNQTLAEDSDGGGFEAVGATTLVATAMFANQTFGDDADGGAIRARGGLVVIDSRIHQNATAGRDASGGGIASSEGPLDLIASSVTENRTDGLLSHGAGVFAADGKVTLSNSTISDNRIDGMADGGGLFGFQSDVEIISSTISHNLAGRQGGGIRIVEAPGQSISIRNSIVAANADSGIAPDLLTALTSLEVRSTLVGDNTGTGLSESQGGDADGNLIGAPLPGAGIIDPLLAPLYFDGIRFFRPLDPASRAIDAAETSLVTSPQDTRGNSFSRIARTAPDMGAYEFQTLNPIELVVTTTSDEIEFGNGQVSLREAIRTANGNPGHDAISFAANSFSQPVAIELAWGEFLVADALTINGSGRDQLTIDAGNASRLFHQVFSAGALNITNMTLTGGQTSASHYETATTTGRGGAILSQSAGSLELDGVAMRENQTTGLGAAGGGIFVTTGSLRIANSSLSGNRTRGTGAGGGAIANDSGKVDLIDSIVDNNATLGEQSPGGAIDAGVATVQVERSTLKSNSTFAADSPGGALHSSSPRLTIEHSFFSNNQTVGDDAPGGALSGNTATIIGSTIAHNRTVGQRSRGGGVHSTQLMLFNSTVTSNETIGPQANGGGIATSGGELIASTIAMNTASELAGGVEWLPADNALLKLRNTIVAGNLDAGTAPDLFRTPPGRGTLAVKHSLIGDNAGTSLVESAVPDQDGNLIGASATGVGIIDPMLGGLMNHGGLVPVHALAEGSPAIDRGDPRFVVSLRNDQRGARFRRVAGGLPDLGAYERQSVPVGLFVVDTPNDELDLGNQTTSLREAILSANGSVGSDVISFDPLVFDSVNTIELTLGSLEITETLTIQGPGRDLLSIDAQGRSRILDFAGTGGDLQLIGMTLRGGNAADSSSGGGIRFLASSGSLTLADMRVASNQSQAHGGGIYSTGNTTLGRTEVLDNRASRSGGGIWATQLTINDSLVANNLTTAGNAGGGGVAAEDATIVNTTVLNNRAEGMNSPGGGIAVLRASLVDSVIRENEASLAGGGGISATDSLQLLGSVVTNNTSGGDGGGIHATTSGPLAIEVERSSISLNVALASGARGGGLFAAGVTNVVDSTISGNQASGTDADGGGLFVSEGDLLVQRSTITENTATARGGGLLVPFNTNASLSIRGSILAMNSDAGFAPNFRSIREQSQQLVDFSLIDDNTGTGLPESQTPSPLGNLVGSPIPGGGGLIDAGLSPLTLVGLSQVHALLAGSPAIDAGNPSGSTSLSDQRGAPFTRVFGVATDIGAFERQNPVEPIIHWPHPPALIAGAALDATHLNATTNAAGTFVYDPPLGTLLAVGTDQTLRVDFVPRRLDFYVPASASVTIDVVEPLDFGDAPATYLTTLNDDGPRHLQSSLRLGDTIDFETDGHPGNRAGGDRLDEDGVTWVTDLVAAAGDSTASVLVTSSATAQLDGWIDFNADGVFDHATEHIGGGNSIAVSRGANLVQIVVPDGSAAGKTFARFRVSSTGGLQPHGLAADGEVEDYELEILAGSLAPQISIDPPGRRVTLAKQVGELLITQDGDLLMRVGESSVGRYSINGSEFSDVLVIDGSGGNPIPSKGLTFDGGDRVNTVRMQGPLVFDVSTGSDLFLQNIDVIDGTNAESQTVVFDAESANRLDPGGGGLIYSGGAEDGVRFADPTAWRMSDPVSFAGFTFSTVVTSGTFVQVDFASPWQNLAQPSDVSNDGQVTALDALRIINELGRRLFSDPNSSDLQDPDEVLVWPNTYYDQNGDGKATGLDALRVINELARIATNTSVQAGEAITAEAEEPFGNPAALIASTVSPNDARRSFEPEPTRDQRGTRVTFSDRVLPASSAQRTETQRTETQRTETQRTETQRSESTLPAQPTAQSFADSSAAVDALLSDSEWLDTFARLLPTNALG